MSYTHHACRYINDERFISDVHVLTFKAVNFFLLKRVYGKSRYILK